MRPPARLHSRVTVGPSAPAPRPAVWPAPRIPAAVRVLAAVAMPAVLVFLIAGCSFPEQPAAAPEPDEIRARLQHASADVRGEAAVLAAERGRTDLLGDLVINLQDGDDGVRVVTWQAVRRLGEPVAERHGGSLADSGYRPWLPRSERAAAVRRIRVLLGLAADGGGAR